MLSKKEQAKYAQMREEQDYKKAIVKQVAPDQLKINDRLFKVVEQEGERALDIDAIADRYMDILDVYDYVVGDWSYQQLRLRGFYRDDQKGVPEEHKAAHITDYLLEFCAFGCDYFILEQVRSPQDEKEQAQEIKERKKSSHQSNTKRRKNSKHKSQGKKKSHRSTHRHKNKYHEVKDANKKQGGKTGRKSHHSSKNKSKASKTSKHSDHSSPSKSSKSNFRIRTNTNKEKK